MRRILRIWPLYFSYVIIGILFSWYTGIITDENWVRSIGLLTFTENIFAAVYGYNPIRFTGHLWTISYEEQFYLLLPFMVLLLAGKASQIRNLFFTGVLIVGLIIRLAFIFVTSKHPAIWVLPITHFESILIGVLIGFNDSKANSISQIVYFMLAIISIAAITLLPSTFVNSYHLMILYPCVGLATGSILCIVLYSKSKFVTGLFSNRLLILLGKVSFGLYVFHPFCITLSEYLLEVGNSLMVSIVSLILTTGIALASYFLLERPFLSLKKNFTTIPSRPD